MWATVSALLCLVVRFYCYFIHVYFLLVLRTNKRIRIRIRTYSRGSSPTRPTRAISRSYSYGKLNDAPTFSRDDPREDVGVGVGVVECELKQNTGGERRE